MFILFYFFLINGTAIYTYIQVVQFCALIKIFAAKINCLQHCSVSDIYKCSVFYIISWMDVDNLLANLIHVEMINTKNVHNHIGTGLSVQSFQMIHLNVWVSVRNVNTALGNIHNVETCLHLICFKQIFCLPNVGHKIHAVEDFHVISRLRMRTPAARMTTWVECLICWVMCDRKYQISLFLTPGKQRVTI